MDAEGGIGEDRDGVREFARRRAAVGAVGVAALHPADTPLPLPLPLPNAWDHASALALAGPGFPAIGTTSLASRGADAPSG